MIRHLLLEALEPRLTLSGGSLTPISPLGPGDHSLSLVWQGLTRSYDVHAPPNVDQPVPVVLVLHGGGSRPEKMKWTTGMDQVADRERFLVVYPAGSHPDPSSSKLYWNDGRPSTDAVWAQTDDVGFVSEILDDLTKHFPVDNSRVYVAGMSNGGSMAYRLAAELSDRIAAIAPVATSRRFDEFDTTDAGQVPVIHFHGRLDNFVPFEGSDAAPGGELFEPMATDAVDEMFATWVAHNESNSTPTTEEIGEAFGSRFEATPSGVPSELWVLNDGGHTWPGRTVPLSPEEIELGLGPVNQDISATEVMWDFFESLNAPLPDNHAPIANDDSLTALADASRTIDVQQELLINDTDADVGDLLTVFQVDTMSAAGFPIANSAAGSITYTPQTDFTGQDSFTYSISDQNGGVATATVHITVHTQSPVSFAARDASGDWLVTSATSAGLSTDVWGSWSKDVQWTNVMVADFNADSLDDLVGRTNGKWWVSVNTGAGFMTERWGKWSQRVKWSNVHVADVDGDGRDDIVGRNGGKWWVARSTGTTFVNELWGKWSTRVKWQHVSVLDVDGDNKDDLFGVAKGKWWVGRSTGTEFQNELWGQQNKNLTLTNLVLGDFTGDGRDDIFGRLDGEALVAISTGHSFQYEAWHDDVTISNWQQAFAIDGNGDGRSDLLRLDDNQWWVSVSTGDRFVDEPWSSPPATNGNDVIQIVDSNLDGKSDVVYQSGDEWWLALSDGQRFHHASLGTLTESSRWSTIRVGAFR